MDTLSHPPAPRPSRDGRIRWEHGSAARGNTGDGFVIASGSRVSDCAASSDPGDGIEISRDIVVVGCVCDGNGTGDGVGIHPTSADNRIEANNCLDNARGIDVDAGGNVIIRNTCSGNTANRDVASGNVCLAVLAPASPVILGNSGGTAGPGDSNANLSY